MTGTNAVKAYLDRKDWLVKENANVRFSAPALNLYMAGGITEEFWLNEVYPRDVAEAHEAGIVHIHNLRDPLVPYCVGWDIADLFIQGFRGPPGVVTSSPPKHLSTALMQLVNFLFSVQGEAAGAVAISNPDTFLAPFVRADSLTYSQVKQAVQEFVFNMNVPTRVGNQPPFSNITLDITPPPGMMSSPAIVGGRPQNYTYGELGKEQGMLVRALFEVLAEGDAAGRPFTFPIPTIDVNHEFPWDDEVLEPMWEATAKYGIPYFANFLSTGRDRNSARAMCCRLRLDVSKIPRKGGVFASHPLTGSIGVITLNLPRLALEPNFLSSVRSWTVRAVRALDIKRAFIERMTEAGLYPYSRFWLRQVKATTGSYWGQHFATVGVIGMHEACLNMGIEGGIMSNEGHALAETTLNAILEEIAAFGDALINLEATPAEGACHRLALIDQARYGERAHHAGPEHAPYYTGSTLPPNDGVGDLFDALKHQAPLQSLYSGGTVFHSWLGERVDPAAAKAFVRRVFNAFPIPYLTLTPTFSVCPTHGYLAGEQPKCTTCGGETEVYSRVVGYLRPVSQWNRGKQAEFRDRQHVSVSRAF